MIGNAGVDNQCVAMAFQKKVYPLMLSYHFLLCEVAIHISNNRNLT